MWHAPLSTLAREWKFTARESVHPTMLRGVSGGGGTRGGSSGSGDGAGEDGGGDGGETRG